MRYKISNPELADKIMQYMVENYDAYRGPNALAKYLGAHVDHVTIAIKEIKRMHINWLDDASGTGNEPFETKASFAHLRIIRDWLKAGGFTELIRDQMDREEKAKAAEELDRISKEVAIAGTKKAMEDADKALELSRLANDIAERSEKKAGESIVIAHSANEIAIASKNAATKAAIISAVISSLLTALLTWYLTKT